MPITISPVKDNKANSPNPKSDVTIDDDYDDPLQGGYDHHANLSTEDDPSWLPAKRQTIRSKRIGSKNLRKPSDDGTREEKVAPSSSISTPSTINRSAQYPIKQGNINQFRTALDGIVDSNTGNYEKIRLKERKSKYTLNSYLTLSLDSAEESINFNESSTHVNQQSLKKKHWLKSNSMSPSPETNSSSKQKSSLMRSGSNDSTGSGGKARNSAKYSTYYYKSEDLPSTHEQHLMHSPYYRALFGNTAALPNNEGDQVAAGLNVNQALFPNNFSQDSADSIISKGSSPFINSPSHPRSRTASQDSSNTSSSSSSSDEELQDRVLKRSHSNNSAHGTVLKRLASHSTSNHNLRRAIYNSSTAPIQPITLPAIRTAPVQANTTSGEEDDSESSKEDKEKYGVLVEGANELLHEVTEVSTAMGEISFPNKLTIDTSNGTNLLNYFEEYPTLRSPKTASALLLESKSLASPKSANLAHSSAASVSSPQSPKPKTLAATPSPSSPATAGNLSIVTNIHQLMMTPSSRTKVPRSPRVFDVGSATKKRISMSENPENSQEFVRKVISLNEEGKEYQLSSPKNSSYSPFRKDISQSFFFSPASVVPAIASQSSIASPFAPSSRGHLEKARSVEKAFPAMPATPENKIPVFRMSSDDCADSTQTTPIRVVSEEEAELDDRMVMSMSMSNSKSNEEAHVTGNAETVKKESQRDEIEIVIRQRPPMFQTDHSEYSCDTLPVTSTRPQINTAPIPPPTLTRQQSYNDTSKIIVDKMKISRFIYTKLIANAIPVAPITVITPLVRRWDDPDSESEEEEDFTNNHPKEGEERINFVDELQELIQEYTEQLNLTSQTIEQKKEKKFFLFEKQYYHPPSQSPTTTHAPSSSLASSSSQAKVDDPSSLIKRQIQQTKQRLKESLLYFEEIDFLWFHKLIANYLQEENIHYFNIFTTPTASNEGEGEEEEAEEENDEENINNNLHKICQYLLSSHFYYYLFAQLPAEDTRFTSKLYELCKILYVQIHANDMKYYENDTEIHQEKMKMIYLKNLVDRNHPPTSKAPSSDGNDSGGGGISSQYSHSYDSCDSMMSFTSCEGEPTYREVPLLMLESLYLVCQERYSRCKTSSKQSYEQELDVNFIAQKGFLSISSTVHHYEHPINTPSSPASTSASVSKKEGGDSSLDNHIHHSLTTHYSLHSVIQAKEERQPFRINDSEYYLLELMKYILKYEFECLIHRLYNGIYDITLVIKNIMIVKYLCLSICEIMKCYGNRLGLTSELVEHPHLLTQLLEIVEAIILFYQVILLELDCIENNLAQDDSIDHYIVILLQKVYILLSATVNSYQNSNNVYYLLLHFVHSQWKVSSSSISSSSSSFAPSSSLPTQCAEIGEDRNNYAQEILYIKLFELLLQYLPPERLLFPNISTYDQTLTTNNHNNYNAASSCLSSPTKRYTAPSTAAASASSFASMKFSTTSTASSSLPRLQLQLPSPTTNVNQKLLLFVKQLFYKLISSLHCHQHFKIIQTIFSFFLNHQSSLLYQYCFPNDFSSYLEDLMVTVENNNNSVSASSASSPSSSSALQKQFELKQQETELFTSYNEERLELIVERLRILRSDYWNPIIKNIANQLLDLIFYQMEQLDNPTEEESNKEGGEVEDESEREG